MGTSDSGDDDNDIDTTPGVVGGVGIATEPVVVVFVTPIRDGTA